MTLIEIVDETAPDKYTFEFDLPKGWKLGKPAESGAVTILDENGESLGAVAPPWAVDADGKELATSFAVHGKNKLVQTVDHEGAAYPILADPSVTLGRNVYLWVWGWEISFLGTSSSVGIATYMCARFGSLHPVLCALTAVAGYWLAQAYATMGSQSCRFVCRSGRRDSRSPSGVLASGEVVSACGLP